MVGESQPLGLDGKGQLEAAAGSVIALSALLTSDDHSVVVSRSIPAQLATQWLASMHALCLEDASSATQAPPTPTATAPVLP